MFEGYAEVHQVGILAPGTAGSPDIGMSDPDSGM
jgi:hypothetical protein